jgi:outer membrane protein TolC
MRETMRFFLLYSALSSMRGWSAISALPGSGSGLATATKGIQPRITVQFINMMTALICLLLGGCASFSRDGGFDTVAAASHERINKDITWVRSDSEAESVRKSVEALLASPLTVDQAVQVALLNNPGLQATYAELGIAEANLVQAGRLRNPGFTFLRAHSDEGTRIERTYTFDFASLIMAPLATRMEGRRFEQTKLLVTGEVLRVAADTRKAYFAALAAQEALGYFEQVKIAAEAGAELAQRMANAGNWSKLDQAREQVFYAEAIAQLARAQQTGIAERERLTRLMGLSGADLAFKLPERLPALPKDKPELRDLEPYAIRERLDIRAAQRDAEALAASLGLTKATRFINVLDVSYLRNSEVGGVRETGYEISLEIPLFDWGGARVAKAQAFYMQAVDRVAETAINARSEVRESYAGYLNAYELARHYRDEIVPLRRTISEENQLRYNGMLISVFELLADAREQVTSVNAYIEALRSFWLAETELQRVLGGRLPVSLADAGSRTNPQPPVAPDATEQSNHQHQKGK